MYLNLIQIAESFGVSEKVVEGWIRNEGLPHTPDRGILLFDRAQVVQWAATRGLATQAGFLAPAPAALETPWRLEPLLRTGGIWRGVAAGDVPEVFAKVVAALPGVTPPFASCWPNGFAGKGEFRSRRSVAGSRCRIPARGSVSVAIRGRSHSSC